MDSMYKKAAQECGIRCSAIKANLSAYYAEELDPATKKAIEAHLEKCPSCRSDFAEYKHVIDVLLANTNKKVDAPKTISSKKRKRMLWLMGHPFFAFCVAHHLLTAFVLSLIIVSLILAGLFTIKAYVREKPVSAPVKIQLEMPQDKLPELEDEPIESGEQIGIEPVSFEFEESTFNE